MQPGWCQPVRQEFMENECEALPGVAYPGVRDNRSTLNTKPGYDLLKEHKFITSTEEVTFSSELVWQRDYAETARQIFIKFGGNVVHEPQK